MVKMEMMEIENVSRDKLDDVLFCTVNRCTEPLFTD